MPHQYQPPTITRMACLALAFVVACSVAPRPVAEEQISKGGEIDFAVVPELPITRAGEQLIVLGLTEVPDGSRLQAAYALADALARSELAKVLQVTLAALDRERDNSGGELWVATASAEVAAASFVDLPLPQHAWQRVQRADGEVVLRVASVFRIPQSVLAAALASAVSPEFVVQVLEAVAGPP